MRTLSENRPGTALIHTGTNSLSKGSSSIIVENILNIVQTCKNYGANTVLV